MSTALRSIRAGVPWAALALAGGLLAGWVDMHNNEVQAAVLVVLLVAGLLGLVRPRAAWLWGLLVGAGVPLAYLFAAAFRLQLREWPQPGWYASALAIIPGVLAALAGAAVRWLARQVRG